MRAMVMHEFGGEDVLQLEHVQKPRISEAEILVEVKSVGVNPIDYIVRSVGGPYREDIEASLPAILGWDIAGVVSESHSDKFSSGDKIFALSRFPQITGGYAEFASVPADQAVIIPPNISFEEAAAVPLAALTAWQALVQTADVQPGSKVLIHAAAGGVGHFAVQFAKLRGAFVVATASEYNRDFLMDLGVNEVVDYTSKNIAEEVSDIDIVLHALPPDLREKVSWPCLKSGGLLLSLSGPVPDEEAVKYNARGAQIAVRPDGTQLAEIGSLITDGKLRIVLDRTYSLEEVGSAHSQLLTRHTRGKIVLKLA
jgi:NADPH:quinone reductase-like Zn-dependent oxidoreductase